MRSATFPPELGGDGSTVTDDANPTTGLAQGGHRPRFVPALAQVVAVAGFVKNLANQNSAEYQQALDAANRAEAAAENAEAIVTGGTAVSDPEAGKIPLADSRSLINNGWLLPVQTAAERHARLAARREAMAGSGFIEFGRTSGTGTKASGIGVNTDHIRLGGGSGGVSRSAQAIINAHGSRFNQGPSLAVGVGAAAGQVRIKLPAASIDPALPSYQCLVFAEVFSQAVTGGSGSGRIFPRGFVQCQSTTFEGVALTQNDPASFSAYGKWDVDAGTAQAGYSLVYGTASRSNLLTLLADPETAETLWWDGDVLVQDLIRFRVTPFPGNFPVSDSGAYRLIKAPTAGSNVYFAYSNTTSATPRVQGAFASLASDHGSSATCFASNTGYDIDDVGVWNNRINSYGDGYNGSPVRAIPILLWQVGNQGAYHPEFNPDGFGKILNNDDSTPAFWYDTDRTISSMQDCFDHVVGGESASGISGHPDGWYHDYRYPEQHVADLRYNANKVNDLNAETEKASNNFLNSTYENLQVRGEALGRMEVVQLGNLDTSGFTDGVDDSAAGRLHFSPNGTYIASLTPRDVGSILIGSTGTAYRVSSIQGSSIVYIAALDGSVPSSATLTTEFAYPTLFQMWKRDTSNLPSDPARLATPIWCDIIGDPANYPDWVTGKSAGDLAFNGAPCVVDVNDPDYARQYPADVAIRNTPTVGNYKPFRLSRKNASVRLVLAYSGGTYSVLNHGTVLGRYYIGLGQVARNTILFYSDDWSGGGSFDDNTVFFVFYKTEANPLELSSIGSALTNDICAVNEDDLAAAVSHMTGRIPVRNVAGQGVFYKSKLCQSGVGGGINVTAYAVPHPHEPLALTDFNGDSPAVKFIPQLDNNGGVLDLLLYFQELLYDATDGGYVDDGEIVPTNDLSKKTSAGTEAMELLEGTYRLKSNRIWSEH